jgi:hypothetical protein
VQIIDLGFVAHRGSYLREVWNVLDFVTVVFALFSMGVTLFASKETAKHLSILKSLRVLRVLRPLKMIKKIPKLKVHGIKLGEKRNFINVHIHANNADGVRLCGDIFEERVQHPHRVLHLPIDLRHHGRADVQSMSPKYQPNVHACVSLG